MHAESQEPTERTRVRLTADHLDRLSVLAAQDRDMFYQRRPEFRPMHMATVLAQGAAQHWVDGTHGVKDLDVWSFFALPPDIARFPADVRQTHVDFGPSRPRPPRV